MPAKTEEQEMLELRQQLAKKRRNKRRKAKTSEIKYLGDFRKKQMVDVIIKKKRDAEREKLQLNNKVRKYTREMQNRDAISQLSSMMGEKAQQTMSGYDDDFAVDMIAPTDRFNDLIYNSATPDDVIELINKAFDEAYDASEIDID